MGWYSSALIVTLVFGVLFSALYASASQSIPKHPADAIPPTQPKISQVQAIEIAEQNIRKHVPDLEEAWLQFSLYNFTSEKYNNPDADPAYVDYINSVARHGGWPFSHIKEHPELLQLPLFFESRNGTLYGINATLHKVMSGYTPNPACSICSPIGFSGIQNAVRDRLVYKFEVAGWNPYSTKQTPLPFSIYLIDAETGEVVWDSIDYSLNDKPMPPHVQFYDQANPPKTIKQMVEERLNPSQKITIKIVQEAGNDNNNNITQAKHFLPKLVRGIIGLSNKAVWHNEDTVAHTVTSDNGYSNPYTGKLDSGIIEAGQTYQYTFMDVGEYPYHCKIHPFMTGRVEIVENFA